MSKYALIFLALGFIGCQHIKKNNGEKKDLKVSAFWVQDTLKEPNIGYRKVNRFAPVLYKDLIVVANGLEGLVAYDVLDKTKKWSIAIDKGIESAGTVINSRLFVGGLNGVFYSIDLDTSKIVWEFDTRSEVVAEPLLHDGFVYFLSGSNILYCLDATNGRQIWVYNRQDTAAQMTVRGGAKPAISSGQIYQGFSDGSLVSLNSKTGTPNWEVLLNRNTKFKDIDASAVIDNDTIYINSYDDKLYAVSKSSGTILWKSDFGGATPPLVFSDRLVYTSSKGHLMVVTKKSGDLIWKVSNLKGIATEPVSHKGLIVVGESQGAVLFYDLSNGQLQGSFDPGRGILGRITTDKNKRVYFISGEANVYGVLVEYTNKNSNFSFLE
ncbi:MAG: PQQ-binding-like beta-propeller repeat protein [Bdellovibrionota bacterium]